MSSVVKSGVVSVRSSKSSITSSEYQSGKQMSVIDLITVLVFGVVLDVFLDFLLTPDYDLRPTLPRSVRPAFA
jgi:uncharacterized membrane protein YczE